jgi:hypothetical protein
MRNLTFITVGGLAPTWLNLVRTFGADFSQSGA